MTHGIGDLPDDIAQAIAEEPNLESGGWRLVGLIGEWILGAMAGLIFLIGGGTLAACFFKQGEPGADWMFGIGVFFLGVNALVFVLGIGIMMRDLEPRNHRRRPGPGRSARSRHAHARRQLHAVRTELQMAARIRRRHPDHSRAHALAL